MISLTSDELRYGKRVASRADVAQLVRARRARRPAAAQPASGRDAMSAPRVHLRAQATDPSDKTGLQINFGFRSRPKHFYFISERACQDAFRQISAWLRMDDRTPDRHAAALVGRGPRQRRSQE